ncbi:MAG TPA: 4Fe-4S binding protein [Dehalococcoidia bacterium]|nr:4Fe-4S binding protein [Dehalococcoidia bacterium]
MNFPEEIRPLWTGRSRTNLLWFDERCTGCSTCAQACPDGCILVATEPRPDGSLDKVRYEIDFRICMYCGLCTEACPYDAIQPGGDYRTSVYFFDDMYQDKYDLTRLAHDYLRTHEYEYPNGMKTPANVVAFIEAEARGETAMPPGNTHAQIPSQPHRDAQSQLGMP